jgi:hypothetical protein
MRQLAWRRKHREVRCWSCLRDNRKKIIGIVGTRISFGGIFASLPRVKHLASCTNLAPALLANNYSSIGAYLKIICWILETWFVLQ